MITGVYFFMAILTIACTPQNTATTDITLDTQDQKVSYAIGRQFGQSLKAQGVNVDVDVMAMSIQDVITDKKSRMTDEEMMKAIRDMQKTAMEHQQQQAEANKKAGEEFLNENKKAQGIVSTDSGLQYQVQKMGDGPKPTIDSTVRVHYKGTLISGEEFDSSYKRGTPIEFPVKGVIPGWTEALQLMPVGSQWKLFIPSHLAYGPRMQQKIPANSTLLFDVELLDIVDDQKTQKADTPKSPSQ